MRENSFGVIRITPHSRKVINELIILAIQGALIIAGVAIPMVRYIAFAYSVVAIMMYDLQTAFCYMFFLMPFATVFKFSAGSSSNFTYLQLLLVARCLSTSIARMRWEYLVSLFMFAVYVVIGSHMDVLLIVKQIMIPLTIYCFFRAYKADVELVLRFFVFGLLLSSTVSLFLDSIPNLNSFVILDSAFELEGNVLRASGLYSDPNYYSLALLMAISGLLSLYAVRKAGTFSLVCAGLLIVFGARTVSKTFLLVLAFVLVLLTLNLYFMKRTGTAVALTAIGALLIAAVFSGRISIFADILARFEAGGGDLSALTTGRASIWEGYINVIFYDMIHPITGFGIGMRYPYGVAAHNTLLDFLYYYGFLGTGLFIAVCASACYGRKKRKFTMMNLYGWAIFLILSMTLSCLKVFDFAFIIIFVILIYRKDFQVTQIPVIEDKK